MPLDVPRSSAPRRPEEQRRRRRRREPRPSLRGMPRRVAPWRRSTDPPRDPPPPLPRRARLRRTKEGSRVARPALPDVTRSPLVCPPAPTPTSLGGTHDPLEPVTHAEMRAALRAAPNGSHVRAVLAAVLLHIGNQGEPCCASVNTIATLAGVDRRSAQRVLNQLVPSVLLRSDTPGKSSCWTLTLDTSDPRHQRLETPASRDTSVYPPWTPASTKEENLEPTALRVEREPLTLLPAPQKKAKSPRVPAPASAPARKAPPNALIFEALVSAAGWNLDTLTKTQRGQTARYAKELADVGATPDLVREQAEILELAWQQKPSPGTVAKHWGTQPKTSRQSAAGRWS